jgi:very-short-patch-repair endonuclease
LATRQHGLASRTQLLALGYSKQAIQTRSTTGRLHRIHRGVYAVGHTKLTLRARWMAAVLACGTGGSWSVLSHRCAAALHALIGVPSGPIDVTAPVRHNLPGIRCHIIRQPDPRNATVRDAIPVTTVSRTLLDLAASLHAQRLRSTIEAAQRTELLDIAEIRALIDRSQGHRGARPLTRALAELHDEAPWIQSGNERRLLEIVRDAGLPDPRTNVLVDGELVDAHWPQHNLVVEVDGWTFHKTAQAFEGDRQKDAKLVGNGRRVVRFTDKRLRHAPEAVAATLTRLLTV